MFPRQNSRGRISLPKEIDAIHSGPLARRDPYDLFPEFRVDTRPTAIVVEELRTVLEGSQNERAMQEFLELHPEVLAACVAAHHWGWVLPQRRLGAQYVTDFLVCGRSSLGFEWVAVELESPTAALFTKTGDVAQTLNHAIRQILDWRNWLADNLDHARRPREDNGLGFREIDNHPPGLILVGRRSMLDDATRKRRRLLSQELGIRIHTYDFLIDACTRFVPGGLMRNPGAPD